ncbi:hypothetical protein [Saccharopolyspora sp. NPDC002376]
MFYGTSDAVVIYQELAPYGLVRDPMVELRREFCGLCGPLDR